MQFPPLGMWLRFGSGILCCSFVQTAVFDKKFGVQTREIVLGGGNIHCITQQQPMPVQSGA
jgi:hypothetical protein